MIEVTPEMVREIYTRINFVDHDDSGIAEGLAVVLAAERERIRSILVGPMLAARRCIPDGQHRDGCVVNDGAAVRERLRQAYREAFPLPVSGPTNHPFQPYPDPNFGSAFGGGCGAQVTVPGDITRICGWPRSAHRGEPDA